MVLEFKGSNYTKASCDALGYRFYPTYSRIRDRKEYGDAIQEIEWNNSIDSISTAKSVDRIFRSKASA